MSAAEWDVALDDWFVAFRAEHRYATAKTHRSRLAQLASEQAASSPWELTTRDLSDWVWSGGACARHRWTAARTFYGWALRVGRVTSSPVPLRSPRPQPEGVSAASAITGVPTPWIQPLADYRAFAAAAGRAPATLRTIQPYLRRLAMAFPDGPWTVRPVDLAVWLAAPAWRPETRKSARTAVRGFYADAVRRGLLGESPADHLSTVRVPRAVPRPIALDALRTAVLRGTDCDRLMLLLGVLAGLRAREIAAVRPSTDMQDGFLFVTGKGGHQRRIPVHPILGGEIEAERVRRREGRIGTGFRYVWQATADDYLFPGLAGEHMEPASVSRRLGKVLPAPWTAHKLRHRFASAAYAVDRDIRAVQELLGHASPVTTAIYTEAPDTAKLAAVLGIDGSWFDD